MRLLKAVPLLVLLWATGHWALELYPLAERDEQYPSAHTDD
jgi:hypothetical protein